MHVYTQCPGSQTPDKSNICHPTSPFLDTSPPLYFLQMHTYRCPVHPSKALFAHRDSTYACMVYIPNHGFKESDRSTYLLPACSVTVPTYKQGFRRKSDHSAEFYLFSRYIRIQEYRIYHAWFFLLFFFVRGRTRCSKVMSIPSTPGFYISTI